MLGLIMLWNLYNIRGLLNYGVDNALKLIEIIGLVNSGLYIAPELIGDQRLFE